MAIEQHELLRLLVGCCPDLRTRLVMTAEDWLQEDGSISYFRVVSVLEAWVVERLDEGDYNFAADLFALVERLLAEGSADVQSVVATGFLEGLVHQDRLPADLWVSLAGPRALAYLRAWDQFTGVSTPGLDANGEPNAAADGGRDSGS